MAFTNTVILGVTGETVEVSGPLTDTQLRAVAVPVSGTVTANVSSVTANAGTNLNTSALALETGGNLAGAATSLGVMDDWDNADKCKVQPTDQFAWSADCTPNSELLTAPKIRLVGAIFNGGTIDTNFWTATTPTGATLTQANNSLILTSGASTNDYAGVYSVRRANWVTGSSNKFRSQVRFEDTGTTNLVRRWGVGWASSMAATAVTDGACFKLNGTAFSIVTFYNSTSGTEVASTSFNGTYSAPTWTNLNTFEILYTLGKVYFIMNGTIIHTVTASTQHWCSGTVNFHIFADVKTTPSTASAKAMYMRMMNISRLGNMLTMPQYKHISGNGATWILKYGGGILHKLIFNNVTGTSVTIYDDSAATAGKELGIITTVTAVVGSWDYEMPFFNGLTIVTAGNGLDATVVYE